MTTPRKVSVNLLCSICAHPIDRQPGWDLGHNAWPVNAGRCCTSCNDTVVIPARLAKLYFANPETTTDG